MTPAGEMSGQPLTHFLNHYLPVLIRHSPQVLVGKAGNKSRKCVRHAPSAGGSPQIIGGRRVPARDMYAIGYVADRHFFLRPAWKEGLEDLPANATVQPADAKSRQ